MQGPRRTSILLLDELTDQSTTRQSQLRASVMRRSKKHTSDDDSVLELNDIIDELVGEEVNRRCSIRMEEDLSILEVFIKLLPTREK